MARGKPRRAANGQGERPRWNPDRKRYEARLTIGLRAVELDDGTTRTEAVRRMVTAPTQEELATKLDALRRAIAAGPTLAADPTVAEWLDHWLHEVLPHTDVAATTRDNYERVVSLYIEPHVGRLKLAKLAPADVRRMIARLDADGKSPNTQRLARSVLRRSLRAAQVDGLVARNVAALADGVRLGRSTKGRTLTPDQARALLSTAAGGRYEALVTLLLALGLRRGEALGLSWSDVELERTPATLTVARALKKDARGALYLDDPKTIGSRRTLHLPGFVVDALRRQRAQQAADRLAFGAGWGGPWLAEELVFTSTIGTPVDPDNFRREFSRLTEQAGLGHWTPHELRHSAASLLLANGVPLKEISEALGHSSIRVTADVYGHLLEPARASVADAMTKALAQ